MLSGANEIQEYKWEEGSLYRPAADSGSEFKTVDWNWGRRREAANAYAKYCEKKCEERDLGVQWSSTTYEVLILQLLKQEDSICLDKIFTWIKKWKSVIYKNGFRSRGMKYK
jgi:hypothetical protein